MDKEMLKEYISELLEKADEAKTDGDANMTDINFGILLGIQKAINVLQRKLLLSDELEEYGLDFDFDERYRMKKSNA